METSEQDLLASKMLLDKELYPQSLFYLQQSVEKLTKYIGLTNGAIDQKDLLRGIGQSSIKVYKKSMKEFKGKFPEMVKINIDQAFDEIKEIAEINPIDEVVKTILNQIDEAVTKQPELPFNVKGMETGDDFCKIISIVDPSNEHLDELLLWKNDPLFKPIFDKMIKEFRPKLLNYSGGIFIVFLISLITDKLVTLTRYPDIDTMVSPSIIFNLDHPIVSNLRKFQEALAYSLEVIRNMKV